MTTTRNAIHRCLKNKHFKTAACAVITLLFFNAHGLYAAEEEQNLKDDSTVLSSVVSTLESNPRLTELQRNREAVQQDLRQARGRYYPRVDLNAGVGTDAHSDIGTRARDEENDFDGRSEASIILTQPLYQGGEISSNVEKQAANLDSAHYRVYDNAESLALDAIIAHMEVWRQRQLLDLTEENISTHKRILKDIAERQRGGAGSSADVVQTKGRLALTQSSRARIVGELDRARANFYRVVGHSPGKQLLSPKSYLRLAPVSAESSVSEAMNCNPKLAALQADIVASRSEVGVKKSSFYPKVNLELSSTYEDRVESYPEYTHNNAAMVRARWNLFNGGSDKAASKAASSRKLQLTEARKDKFQNIEEQIYSTWSQFLISGEQVKTFSDAEKFNTETRDAYLQQFVVGQRSLLDVLDSENELFQSSSQLVTAKTNEVIAVYRLLALKGCLLTSLEVDLAAFDLKANPNSCCSKAPWLDSDGDGIPDQRDSCPDTPAGVKVDWTGCPDKPKPIATKSAEVTEEGTWLYKDIKFEINKSDLRPGSYPVLEEIAVWLKSKPKLVVEVQGHSDITGTRNYNLGLSQRRAQTVINYLRQNGIQSNRMTPKGFGPDRPLADNATVQGRAKNRRVELRPIGW